MKLHFWMAAPENMCKFSSTDDQTFVSIDRDHWLDTKCPIIRPQTSIEEVLEQVAIRIPEEGDSEYLIFSIEISDKEKVQTIMQIGFDLVFDQIKVVDILKKA